EKGRHTISLSSTYAPYKNIEVLLEQALQDLGKVSRDIQILTRGEDDPYRTWNIVGDFPEIPQMLTSVREKLMVMADEWLRVNKMTDANHQVLVSAAVDLE